MSFNWKAFKRTYWYYFKRAIIKDWSFWLLISLYSLRFLVAFFWDDLKNTFNIEKTDFLSCFSQSFLALLGTLGTSGLSRDLSVLAWNVAFSVFFVSRTFAIFKLVSRESYKEGLFTKFRSTGEDELLLTFASPIGRWEMFLSKISAFLTRSFFFSLVSSLPFLCFYQGSWWLLNVILVNLVFLPLVDAAICSPFFWSMQWGQYFFSLLLLLIFSPIAVSFLLLEGIKKGIIRSETIKNTITWLSQNISWFTTLWSLIISSIWGITFFSLYGKRFLKEDFSN